MMFARMIKRNWREQDNEGFPPPFPIILTDIILPFPLNC